MGGFGENLTIEGISEDELYIGDELEIGTALFRLRQPRTPCWKLGVRFDRDDMTRLFYESRRFGGYLSVLREGVLQAGDEIRIVARDPGAVSLSEIVSLFTGDSDDPELLDRVLKVQALPENWREWFQQKVSQQPVQRTT
jgi:MOSC domain-containing protein YiiM